MVHRGGSLATRVVHGPGWADGGPDEQRARRRAALGVFAVALILLGFGSARAIGTPPFAPADETSHVAYALAVAEGYIPEIDEFPKDAPIPGMPTGLSIWTSNHPPGTYLVEAVPLAGGVALGIPLAGFWAARLLNLLAVALTVVVVGRITATLLPSRPRVVVTTAALFGLVPYFVHIASLAYTDGLALLPTVGVLAVAVEALVRGPSKRSFILLLVLAAVCALVRPQSLVVLAFAGTGYGLGVFMHVDGAVRRRLLLGTATTAAAGATALAAGGWFIWRNYQLYGDPSGSAALYELHNRQPRGRFAEWFFSGAQVRFQVRHIWGQVEGLPPGEEDFVLRGDVVQVIQNVSLALIVLALTVAVLRVRRQGSFSLRGHFAGWTLLWVVLVVLYALMIEFTTNGGSPHSRYYWPGLIPLAGAIALGLDVIRVPLPARLSARRATVPVGALAGIATVVLANVVGWPRALVTFGVTEDVLSYPQAVVSSFEARQLPAALAIGLLVAIAIGLAGVISSLLLLPDDLPTDETAPEPYRGDVGLDAELTEDVAFASFVEDPA